MLDDDAFHWYDPYSSFLSGAPPCFRDKNGKQLAEDDCTNGLLHIGIGVGKSLGTFPSRDEWNSALAGFLQMKGILKEQLQQATTTGNVTFVNHRGKEHLPTWDELSYAHVVDAAYALYKQAAPEADLAQGFAGPFCIAALLHIDDALMAVKFQSDMGTWGIDAAIDAAQALANVRALLEKRELPFTEFSRRGTDERHRITRTLRGFAIARYQTGNFPSPHKASIELTPAVIEESEKLGRPLSKDRAQKTIYEWLLAANKKAP